MQPTDIESAEPRVHLLSRVSFARSSYHPGANDEESGSSTVEFELPLHSGEHSSFSGDCVLDFPSTPAVHTVLVQCELVDHQGGRSEPALASCVYSVLCNRWVGNRAANCSSFSVRVVVPPK